MYQVASRKQSRRRRSRLWLCFALLFLIVAAVAGYYTWKSLQQKPVVSQSKAVITKISYQGKTKHYTEDNFSIDIPIEWQADPRPVNTYQSFTWHNISKANSEAIEVYEDTIPTNFSVNRALVVNGALDHLELTGQASENCVNFTKDLVTGQSELGVRAKWQNVDFLCNRITTSRDVIGTSSTDGINTVILRGTNGVKHRFFFTYTDNQLSPDYTVFYNALASFGMN